MGKKLRKRINCSNCNHQLKEQMNFCFHCGQENHVKRVSLKMLFQDFFATYFTFDSKLWVTLKMLILKPSYLSKVYLEGKIVTYLPPIRLYIFISFLFFLVFNLTPTNFLQNVDLNLETDSVTTKTEDEPSLSYKKIANFLKEVAQKKAAKQTDGATLSLPGQLEDKVLSKFTKEHEIKAFMGLMKSKLPFVFFLLIPVLAFLYFILFYKKEYFYVDHLVFVLHLQSFMFLVLTVDVLISSLFGVNTLMIPSIITMVYTYITMKRFFNKKKWGVIWRLVIIAFLYTTAMVFVFVGYFLVMLNYYE